MIDNKTSYVGFNGIVDKVRAIRHRDEVSYLEATVHITMGDDYVGPYGDKVKVDLSLPLPVSSDVNPGDVVSVNFTFANPFGRRFVGALTVGNEEEEVEIDLGSAMTDDVAKQGDVLEEVLEVMVEDGMVEDSKEDDDADSN